MPAPDLCWQAEERAEPGQGSGSTLPRLERQARMLGRNRGLRRGRSTQAVTSGAPGALRVVAAGGGGECRSLARSAAGGGGGGCDGDAATPREEEERGGDAP